MEEFKVKIPKHHVPLGLPALDRFLRGGLPAGSVSEWGAPWGQGGRELLLRALGSASRRDTDARLLWISVDKHLNVYSPRWRALGVPLERWRFARVDRPVKELKPVLLSPVFRFLVFDAPRNLSPDDLAFLAIQARHNRQFILVLRDGWLGGDQGNVFARLRINCHYDPTSRRFHLTPIRGLPPGELWLSRQELEEEPS